MALDSEVSRIVRGVLEAADALHFRGHPSVDTATRLADRVRMLHGLAGPGLSTGGGAPDFEAIELACLALQLQPKHALKASSKPHRPTLKERSGQSVELLLSLLREDAHHAPLDAAVRLLNDVARRVPESVEARLLADAMNLEDFGILGLIAQFAALVRQGHGPAQLVEGADKREQYGYWDARLKDGFHFEASRRLARERLADARHTTKLLAAELHESGA